LGCIQALNLDGGKFYHGYEEMVKNIPCGDEDENMEKEHLRRVSDAIAVFLKK
jgi:hypothetical protein